MATFILVDSFNMYHRAKHVAMRGSNVDMYWVWLFIL